MIWPLGIWCLGKDVVATQLQDEEESGFFSQEMCFTFRHWNVTFMVVLLKVAEIFSRYTFPFFSSCLRMTVIYTHTQQLCVSLENVKRFQKVGGWGQEAIREEETVVALLLPLDSFSSHQDKMNQSIRQLNLGDISRREGNKGLIDPLLTGKPYIITNGLFDGLCISSCQSPPPPVHTDTRPAKSIGDIIIPSRFSNDTRRLPSVNRGRKMEKK